MKEAYVKPNAIQESALTGVIPAAIAVGPLTAALLGGDGSWCGGWAYAKR